MTGQSLIPKALKWTDEESALKTIREYGKNLNGSIKKAAQAKKLEKMLKLKEFDEFLDKLVLKNGITKY